MIKAHIDEKEIRQFEEALGRLVREAGISASTVVRKVFFDVMRDVMRANPVDTGRSRAAWSVAFDHGGGGAPSIGGDGSGIAEGKRLGEYDGNLPSSVSSDIHRPTDDDRPYAEITNNVRYILPLEFGSSRQAPNGMVRATIRRHAKHFLAEMRRGA